ncbi:hypothetical protein [Miniimonas sp. S16]|uniref:hypothetical protein n=1 Tax=Miniimonas sp. S16 TaxID=2171623 RepID=UPI000D526471|nr:hypothetical protein [Miniimonas sp. S16]
MTDGFRVDLTALDDAVNGIVDTMDQMATKKVEDLQVGGSDVGHGDLSDVLGQFCRRWDIGVTNLVSDVGGVIDRLVYVRDTYRATDEAYAAGFTGVIGRDHGVDPAAG